MSIFSKEHGLVAAAFVDDGEDAEERFRRSFDRNDLDSSDPFVGNSLLLRSCGCACFDDVVVSPNMDEYILLLLMQQFESKDYRCYWMVGMGWIP